MDYFDISNKEKIESQLFGDTSGISEEEVIEELSNQLDELPDGETSPEKAEAFSPEDSQSPDDINNPEEKSDGFLSQHTDESFDQCSDQCTDPQSGQ